MSRRRRDSIELDAGPIFPGNGYPSNPGEMRPGLSPFGRLAMGQTIGKSSILIYDADACGVQPAPVDMLTIEGDNLDSWQIVVTLHPPRVIPLSIDDVRCQLDQQNLTGEQRNNEVTTGCFPGTKRQMQWPPLEALVEFGTGGVSTSVVVDYVNGVTLAVVASYLRVHALVSQSRDCGDIYGTSAAYYLAAHAGPGFAVPHAQRTVFVGRVADGDESDVFSTPFFAKTATIIGGYAQHPHHEDAVLPVETKGFIRFWQCADGTHPVGDVIFVGDSLPIKVPNTAMYFSVFNDSGASLKMSVIFELAL